MWVLANDTQCFTEHCILCVKICSDGNVLNNKSIKSIQMGFDSCEIETIDSVNGKYVDSNHHDALIWWNYLLNGMNVCMNIGFKIAIQHHTIHVILFNMMAFFIYFWSREL